jgi:hypothetical protein
MTVTRLLIALVPAAAVATGNYVVAGLLTNAAAPCHACLAWLVGAPIVLGVLLASVTPRPAAPAAPVHPVPASPPPPPPEPPGTAALALLATLQEEGRLVDFLEEDLSGYADEQIGAGVREIHDKCRTALRSRVSLAPVLQAAEGEPVTVEPGFDPAAIRLTGKVAGAPPFRGVLRHKGWRVTQSTLQPRRDHDPHVIAPAEVEIL